MNLIAVRGRQYLIGEDPSSGESARGFIYSTLTHTLSPPGLVHTFLSLGYWSDPPSSIPAEVTALLQEELQHRLITEGLPGR